MVLQNPPYLRRFSIVDTSKRRSEGWRRRLREKDEFRTMVDPSYALV